MITIAFFNNKGGVEKTSLAYHLAWKFRDLGYNVLACDLDPQANLTSMFVSPERLERIWEDQGHSYTMYGALKPILDGLGDVAEPNVERFGDNIGVMPGDLALSLCEDELSGQWPQCMNRSARAYRVMSAFYRAMLSASRRHGSQIVLIDLGPNLGAINRAALIAADHVVVPLAPDIYSLQGLKNLGQRLEEWRVDWRDRWQRCDIARLELPKGRMAPLGYVLMKHSVRLNRPVKAYEYWMQRIPHAYARALHPGEKVEANRSLDTDPNCLAMLKDYNSLMPNAQRLNKPMFHLTTKDGVFGSNATAVKDCSQDFERLAVRLLKKIAESKSTVAERVAAAV